MPRLKETENQKKDNFVRAYIAKNKELVGLTDQEISARLHMTRNTYYLKKKKPSTFTLGEIRKLVEILKFSEEEKKVFM